MEKTPPPTLSPEREGLIEILLRRFQMATPTQQLAIVERAMRRDVWPLEFALTEILDRSNLNRSCIECGRVFDMLNPDDAVEFTNGHDCEA